MSKQKPLAICRELRDILHSKDKRGKYINDVLCISRFRVQINFGIKQSIVIRYGPYGNHGNQLQTMGNNILYNRHTGWDSARGAADNLFKRIQATKQ